MGTTITRYGMEFFQNFFRLRDQIDRERGLSAIERASAIEHAILNGTPDHEVRKMIREDNVRSLAGSLRKMRVDAAK
jgi:HAMP domain-containing protein